MGVVVKIQRVEDLHTIQSLILFVCRFNSGCNNVFRKGLEYSEMGTFQKNYSVTEAKLFRLKLYNRTLNNMMFYEFLESKRKILKTNLYQFNIENE